MEDNKRLERIEDKIDAVVADIGVIKVTLAQVDSQGLT